MVYLLRIQMFGDQARELLLDEQRPGPPRHPERLDRVLRTLSISKPDRVRPIFKSGFFLCYYNEENDAIVRELKRSVTLDDRTKKIFDELCVAYMLLTMVGGNGTIFDSRWKPRDRRRSRSRSPRPGPSYQKYSTFKRERYQSSSSRYPTTEHTALWDKPSVPTGVTPTPSLSSLQPTASSSSIEDAVAVLANPTDKVMHALKVLQNSATMQALMKQEPQNNEVIVKTEETEPSLDAFPTTSPTDSSSVKRPKILRDRYIRGNANYPISPSTSQQGPSAYKISSTYRTDTQNRPPMEPKKTSAKQFERESDEESKLTRDLSDIRRQMAALKAQEDNLIERLKKINPSAVKEDSRAEKTKENGYAALADLQAEREKRRRAEEVWEDARKEYRAPLVVPAMLDAFEKLAQIAGDALVSTTTSVPSTAKASTSGNEFQDNRRWGPRKPTV